MSLVPGFRYDLFVSYAHRNDSPWREGGVGWVTEFVEMLARRLQEGDRRFQLWWDPVLRSGEDFNDAIAQAVSESAVFLTVLSPAYDDSGYCRREVQTFREQRHPAFGMKAGALSRMQGIVLEELAQDRWPPEVRSTSPCCFFSAELPRFTKPAAADVRDPYFRELWRTADSILAVLKEMARRKERGIVVERAYDVHSGGGAPAVYLAEVADDVYEKRESLRTALEQLHEFGVGAIDETAPPADPSALSVHLFGLLPGRPAAGQDTPRPRRQLEIVLEANPARRPLVWLARDIAPDSAASASHREFLNSLLANGRLELLRAGFEDLKQEVQKRMRPPDSPVLKTVRRAREDPIVHIWHKAANADSVLRLKQYLKQRNCGISVFSCDTVPAGRLQTKLDICDGLVVSYTAETKSWAEDVLTETFHLRRREEMPVAFAAVELPPPGSEEFNFEHPRVVPVRGNGEGDFRGIDEFLAKLEAQSV